MNFRFLYFFVITLLLSCDKKGDDKPNFTLQCEDFIELNSNKYDQFNSSSFNIDTVYLDGNCLKISIAASGCDGSSWALDLVDSEAVAESYPIQRFSKLCFTNNELCLAYLTKEYSFDLQPLQYDGDTRVFLNIEGSQGVLYEY